MYVVLGLRRVDVIDYVWEWLLRNRDVDVVVIDDVWRHCIGNFNLDEVLDVGFGSIDCDGLD